MSRLLPILSVLLLAACPGSNGETINVDVSFSVTADEVFVHDEPVEEKNEGSQFDSAEGPVGVDISMEWPQDIEGPVIRFEGALPAGEHSATVNISHYADGPSDYEKWNVTITAE